MRNRWLAASVLAAAAVVGLAACGSGGGNSSAPSATTNPPASSSTGSTSNTTSASATGLKTTTISGHKVLTTAQGFVVYWFAIDTPTKSNCAGQCAANWPPLVGTPTLASGVTLSGKLGTIARSGGVMQATYDGHPLYLFKADTSAGMDSGNDLNAAGGLWWAMTASGAKIKKAASSSGSGSSGSGSSGSGGYGY